MKRRSLLRAILTLPGVAALPADALQKDETATRDKGLPSGPPLVPPGVGETPNTPVTPADQTADEVVSTFTPEQMKTLSKLGQLIVPAWNGNPGASESGAAEFLDFLIGCSPQSRVNLYKEGLDALSRQSQQKFSKSFDLVTPDQAAILLAPLREPWAYRATGGSTGINAFLFAVKSDLLRATVNARPYIDSVSQKRRARNASGFYWYPID